MIDMATEFEQYSLDDWFGNGGGDAGYEDAIGGEVQQPVQQNTRPADVAVPAQAKSQQSTTPSIYQEYVKDSPANGGFAGNRQQSARPSIYSVSQGIESPDLSSVMEEYDRLMEETKREREGWRKSSGIGVLTDIGLLIGDAVGARGNANVNKRDAVTGKFNEQTEKLRDLYWNMAARRPELAAQMLQRKFQNDLAVGNYNLSAENQKYQREYNDSVLNDNREHRKYERERSEKNDAFDQGLETKKFENHVQNQKEVNKINLINAYSNQQRAFNSGSEKGKSNLIQLNVRQGEKDTYVDFSGNLMKDFDFNDKQRRRIFNAAISDSGFITENPQLFQEETRKGLGGEEGTGKYYPRKDKYIMESIVQGYAQKLYNENRLGTAVGQTYPDGLDEFEKYVE
jgi:hypothetical protein